MRRTTRTRSNVSFKCHYCGGGRNGTTTSAKTTLLPSKSLERDRRIVSGKSFTRSKSVNTNGFLPPIYNNNNNSIDYTYIPGRTLTEDDVREELIQLKRRYGLLEKEHSVLKTHLQVATNDLKKREIEIENLLQDPVVLTKSQEQLELNSLKRKIIQYERVLRDKSEEISKLLNDKNILNASENRQKLEKLEKDYEKLKYRLGKSVPHAELEAEKARLSELIESLQRENNELHQILSTFFHDTENGVFLDGNGIRDEKLLEKMREEAAARRNEVERYREALAMLIKDKSYHGSSILIDPIIHKRDSLSKSDKRPKSGKNFEKSMLKNYPLSNKTVISRDMKDNNNDRIKRAMTENKVILKPLKIQHNQKESNQSYQQQSQQQKSLLKNRQLSKTKESTKNTKQPVKDVPGKLKYEDIDSSVPSNNYTSASEHDDAKNITGSEESTAGSYVTNNESNIDGIANDEYHEEQEIEEGTDILITALQCQLLREEMLQTRIMTI